MALDFLARKIPGILDGGTSLVDARDVAAAMVAAVDKGRHGERYIVGGAYRTVEELLRGLEAASGVAAPKLRLPHSAVMAIAWAMETWGRMTGLEVLITREGVRNLHARLAVTSAKAVAELGATFRPLTETLRDVVEWHRQNPLPA